jgi:PAS domain-containing protein
MRIGVLVIQLPTFEVVTSYGRPFDDDATSITGDALATVIDVAPQLYDEAPLAVAIFDPEVHFRYLNAAMVQINGRSADDHLGRHPDELFGFRPEWVDRVQDVLATGHHAQATTLIGPAPWHQSYDVSYSPLVAAGRVIGAVAFVRDTTADRRREEQAVAVTRFVDEVSGATTTDEVVERAVAALVPTVTPWAAVVQERTGRWRTLAATTDAGPARSDPSPALGDLADEAVAKRQLVVAGGVAHPSIEIPVEHRIAAVPVIAGDGADGATVLCVAVATPGPEDRLQDVVPDALDAIVAMFGAALGAAATVETASAAQFRRALDAMLTDVAIGRAVRDHEGTIVDFEIVFANAASSDGIGRRADELVSRRLTELYPGMETSPLWLRLIEVTDRRVPFADPAFSYIDEVDGRTLDGWWQINAVPFEDGYLLSSRDVTAEVVAARAAEAERIATAAERTAVDILQEIGLPKRLPSGRDAVVAARYLAAESDLRIGGDWYDAFELSDGRIAITIGDVAGHGRAAAVAMVRLRLALRSLLGHLDLVDVGDAIRTRAVEIDGFATACVAVIDPAARTIAMLRAGHLPPMLVSNGRAEFVSGPSAPPLGVTTDARMQVHTIDYEPGCALVLCTDGLVERRDEPIDDSLEHFRRVVASAYEIGRAEELSRQDGGGDDTGSSSGRACAERVADLIIDECVTGPLQDDACLLVVTLSADDAMGPIATP